MRVARTRARDPAPGFWAEFVAGYWQRRPRVFPHALATADEIFGGVRRAREWFRPGDFGTPVRFFVDHALLRADLPKYLPGPEDGSLAQYAERVTRALDGRRFGLIFNRFHRVDPAIWLRLREFLYGLYERVGIPGTLVDVAVFLGTYERTPFGLHKDDSATFTFVVEGRKTVRAWPDEFFRDRPEVCETLDYDRFVPEAVTLEGKPGDVLYWPSSYWHVADSDGSLCASVHLLVGTEAAPQADMADFVQRFVGARLRSAGGPPAFPLRPARLRQAVKAASAVAGAAGRVLARTSRDRDFQRAIRVAWLCRVTGSGFQHVPDPAAPRPLADLDWVRGDPRHPVLWLRWAEELICAANGHAFSVTAHRGVVALLERLNRGDACRVGDLLAAHARTVESRTAVVQLSRRAVRAVLEKLLTVRAIAVTEGTLAPASRSRRRRPS